MFPFHYYRGVDRRFSILYQNSKTKTLTSRVNQSVIPRNGFWENNDVVHNLYSSHCAILHSFWERHDTGHGNDRDRDVAEFLNTLLYSDRESEANCPSLYSSKSDRNSDVDESGRKEGEIDALALMGRLLACNTQSHKCY
jgi:hypothetical protein